jgi:thiamine biosynthesis protein ThiI
VRLLSEWHGPIPLHVVHFTEPQKALREAGPAELAVVLYRRMMMRVATLLARRAGAAALCTGESLAQVASQPWETLRSSRRPPA